MNRTTLSLEHILVINLVNVIYVVKDCQNGRLQNHIKAHTGDKPYKCDVCGKGFSENGSLQNHNKTHTGDKQYKYDVSGKGFSQGVT